METLKIGDLAEYLFPLYRFGKIVKILDVDLTYDTGIAYNIRDEDGKEDWVWGKYLKLYLEYVYEEVPY